MMIGKVFAALLSTAAISILTAAARPASAAESVADFYRGKVIKLVVGNSPGGTYDLYARLVSRHLNRFLPGNPTFVVQNQPGAGSLAATNSVYGALPQDGSIIAGLEAGVLFDQITGNPNAKFETTKFQWLGSLSDEVGVVFTWQTSQVRTFDDLYKHEAVFGAAGPNVTEQLPSVLINMFGAKIKLVTGYPSGTSIYKAIEGGEVEGGALYWASMVGAIPHWIKQNQLNLLVQFALQKHKDLPDTPLIMDLLTEKYLRPDYAPAEARAILRFMMAQQAIARPYAVGPDVPGDRVAAIRTAFTEMVRSDEFLADVAKANRNVNFLDAQSMENLLNEVAKTPRATLDKVAQVSRPNSK